MVERRRRSPLAGALLGLLSGALGAALLGGLGCGASDDNAVSFQDVGDYTLGGQTGSLIPGCGVAPLSAEGRGVPTGDALAVLYAADCPEQAEALALAGSGLNDVHLQLVPLEGSGVFLVRADQALTGGEYQLAVGTAAESELHVADAAPAVPERFGELQAVSAFDGCPDPQFELQLDDAALAYAPLARFEVSIDDGPEQLWVDYGALPIESRADGNWGLLTLPRCGVDSCLESGPHRLQLRVSIAGERLAPELMQLTFSLACGGTGVAEASGDGCSLAGAGGPAPDSVPGRVPCAGIAGYLALCALRRRRTRA